jgi:DNA-binding transcriptional LysR family regulator
MDLEVRHVRALLAVVDAGTFTGAAATLHTTQASVSRTVAALERALGARVLHRTTREVSLTPAGARVVGHARRILEEVAAMRRAADEARADLRVGFAWAALGRHTTGVQRAWSAAHPGSALVFASPTRPPPD